MCESKRLKKHAKLSVHSDRRAIFRASLKNR
jgi:hypothetical protein